MNGRIYDPLLGRMLSADVVVQYPKRLQSYNRYSYVMNNPLTLTDPTGFEADPEGPAEEVPPQVLKDVKIAGESPEEPGPATRALPATSPSDAEISDPNKPSGIFSPRVIEAVVRKIESIVKGSEPPAEETINGEKPTTGSDQGKVDPKRSPSAEADANKEKMAGVREKGKQGEASSQAEAEAAGEKVKGKNVTFKLPSGKTTRSDLVTETKTGDLKVREAKKGDTAKMSPGQKEMKNTVDSGGTVEPRGQKAKDAGLEPRKPVKIKEFEEDRFE